MQKQLNRHGEKAIAGLAGTVKVLWEKACAEDGIPADSAFVVFSEGNKYLPFLGQAQRELWQAQAEYKAGGYVGLRIRTGRAVIS